MIPNEVLKQRQALPIEEKIKMSQERIREWYEAWDGQVYISFSGGKDSTVLLDLVRGLYPEVQAVFLNTGLEYPEILSFVKKFNNVVHIHSKMKFKDVIEKYGYPVVSKEVSKCVFEIRNTKSDYLRSKRLYGDRKGNGKLPKKWQFLTNCNFKISDRCCAQLKKNPIHKYESKSKRVPFIGISFSDSFVRKRFYRQYGCNAFNKTNPSSTPIAFWTEKDIWEYIKRFNLPYSKIYDMGYHNTGCMFCMFGVHLQKQPNKFQLMKQTHPKHWEYCINKLGCGKIMDYINVLYE
jgi:3'-phosphoadenosine 5'-phosphosulfate sulfotransferase (PAPS reductase)/FAD synthetase